MAADRSKLIDSLRIEIELAEKAGANAAVVAKMDRDAQKIQRTIDRVNAKGATEQMQRLEKAIEHSGGAAALSSGQMQRYAADIERLMKAGAAAPTALAGIVDKVRAENVSLKGLVDSIASRGSLASGLAGFAQGAAGTALGAAAAPVAVVGLAAAGVATATAALIKDTLAHADALRTEAAEAQIGIETLQRWKFALRESNAEVTAAVPAMVNFNKTLSESPEKFEKWGLSSQKLRDLKPEQQMEMIAATMGSIAEESDRAAFAHDMFGKSGREMLKALTGDWKALTEAADEYGAVISEQDVKQLEELGSSWERLGGSVESLSLHLGNLLVKSVGAEDLASGLDLIARAIGNLGGFVDKHGDKITRLILLLSPAALQLDKFRMLGTGASALLGIAAGPESEDPRMKWANPNFKTWLDDANAKRKAAEEKAAAAALEKAERAAEAERKKWADIELKDIEARDKAYRSFLEAKLRVFEAEAEHANFLAAKLATDDHGSMVASPFAAPGPIMGAGPAIPDSVMANVTAQALAARIDKKQREKVLEEEIVQILLKHKFTQEQIDEALGRSVDKQMTWAQFAQATANQFASMGTAGSAIAKVLGGVGGIGSMFEKNAAGKNAFSGGLTSLKGLSGGLTAAFAAFDIGKTLYAMFHKTEAQKVAFDVGRDYGVKISEGLSKEIAEKSKTMGREAASLLSLDKIVGEAGGVQAFGVEKTGSKLRDLFSMIQTGKMTADQAKGPFDKLFGEVAQASISKTTGLISAQAAELRDLADASGMKSDAVEKFKNEQRDVASTIIERLAKSDKGFANAGESEAVGNAVAAQFERYVKAGLSGVEIAEKMGPLIESLQDKFHRAGVGGGKAFEAMLGKVEVFRDELTGPVAQGFQDTIGLAAALFNAGDLTKSQFQGLASSAASSFRELQGRLASEGKDPNAAFEMMAGDLQKLWEMQRRFNVDLDENTKKMLAEAQAQGVVGEEFMDPLLREAERTNEILERGFTHLGASFDDMPGKLNMNLPTDLGQYAPGGGVNAANLADALKGLGAGGDGVGAQVSDGLSSVGSGLGELGAGLAGLATQPILNKTTITLSSGAVAAEMASLVSRGGPESTAIVTAIIEKIKARG